MSKKKTKKKLEEKKDIKIEEDNLEQSNTNLENKNFYFSEITKNIGTILENIDDINNMDFEIFNKLLSLIWLKEYEYDEKNIQSQLDEIKVIETEMFKLTDYYFNLIMNVWENFSKEDIKKAIFLFNLIENELKTILELEERRLKYLTWNLLMKKKTTQEFVSNKELDSELLKSNIWVFLTSKIRILQFNLWLYSSIVTFLRSILFK